MPCIKCGRKVNEGQLFCAVCLDAAEKYPREPGAPVQLPSRAPAAVIKARPKKQELRPEEQIRLLRSANRWLMMVLVVLLIAFILMAVLILFMMEDKLAQLPAFPWADRLAAFMQQCFT